jgi:GTP cyclohydrolase I
MLQAAEKAVRALLHALLIDDEDPNTRDTPKRVARMFINEVFAGRYDQRPDLTEFPNGKQLDELYTLGPISIRSACAHHLCPVEGSLWVGVIPGDRIIGISKFSRLARWITARPQIQEEAIVQLADAIEQAIAPRGLIVFMKLQHSCMTWRGVREHATMMSTSVVRGLLRERPVARAEFFSSIGQRGAYAD